LDYYFNTHVCHRLFSENILTTREAAWFIISIDSVCLCISVYFCLSDYNLRMTWRRKFIGLYLHIRYISRGQYGLSSYMAVIGSRSKSQEQKKSTMSIPAT